jgi:hypothetical protein
VKIKKTELYSQKLEGKPSCLKFFFKGTGNFTLLEKVSSRKEIQVNCHTKLSEGKKKKGRDGKNTLKKTCS